MFWERPGGLDLTRDQPLAWPLGASEESSWRGAVCSRPCAEACGWQTGFPRLVHAILSRSFDYVQSTEVKRQA